MTATKRYIITPGFSFHQIETGRAILLHETQSISLSGELYVQVLSKIDLHCSDVITTLEPKFSSAETCYALHYLEGNGYITPRDDAHHYSWWPAIERGNDVSTIFQNPISVESPSVPYKELMLNALTNAGLTNIVTTKDSNVTLILCNDYLEPEVTESQKSAFEQGTSYCFPVKLSGTILWLGPLLKKSQKPCWNCLIKALRKNRPIENYLSENAGKLILPKYQTSAVSLQLGINMAIMQLVRKMIHHSDGDSELITMNTGDLSIEKHCIRIRPQCEVCGNPLLFSQQVNSPVELHDIPRSFTGNGGYRNVAPETTWENYKHLVSPLTGIISHIDKYHKKNHQLRPVWKATYFINPCHRDIERDERFASNSFGKGTTTEQARASALGEAIERYSFLYTGEERIRDTYNKLKPFAIDPEALQHFSARQYASRDKFNTLKSPQKIPLPFDPDKELSWMPVWSLTTNSLRYVPLQHCFSLTPTVPDENMCTFSSNGSAAGNCLEEAILQGLLEVVERDATAIWWYNRIPRPEINLESFHDSYFNDIKKHYHELGWDVWILDITSDLQIPAVVAMARNDTGRHFTVGLGCHLTMHLAIQRAITEMHQIFDPYGTSDPVWKVDEIENPSFLYPANRDSVHSENWALPPERTLKYDILDCVERVQKAGMELLVLNYTRPDIGVPAVKVFIPGLRHFWKQLGPGRLYSVPVQMGWLDMELTEDQLNPVELAL